MSALGQKRTHAVQQRMSALGHKRTFAVQQAMSALPPNNDRKSVFPHNVMSALHLKADMCSAAADVRFGPIADSSSAARECYSITSSAWAKYCQMFPKSIYLDRHRRCGVSGLGWLDR
jgi:Tfp pilus assembly protein PilX